MHKIKNHPYVYYFLFWINVINLSELTSYIILRSFSTHGDMVNFEYGTRLSPWVIFIVGGLFAAAGIFFLFKYILRNTYVVMKLTKSLQALLLILTAFFIFGHAGIRMLLFSYGVFATSLGWVFFLLMIFTIVCCWPGYKKRLF